MRTIVGVSTSDTAFVDCFPRGPMNEAVRITSFDDFERVFGGLHRDSEASYAIQQFFLNGGRSPGSCASPRYAARPRSTTLQRRLAAPEHADGECRKPGHLGQHAPGRGGLPDPRRPTEFNLVVREVGQRAAAEARRSSTSEIHRNLSMDQTRSNSAASVVNAAFAACPDDRSRPGQPPAAATAYGATSTRPPGASTTRTMPDFERQPARRRRRHRRPGSQELIDGMTDAGPNRAVHLQHPLLAARRQPRRGQRQPEQRLSREATAYCEAKRAFLIVDIPALRGDAQTRCDTWMADQRRPAPPQRRRRISRASDHSRSAQRAAAARESGRAARSPALTRAPTPTRGVWKAPAGTDAVLRGATPARSS